MSKLLTAWFNAETNEWFSPKLRMVYPKLLKPEINKAYPDNPPKFSALGLIPKTANIDDLRAALLKSTIALYGANWKDKDPPVKMPIKKTAGNDKLAEFAEDFPFFLSVGSTQEYPPAVFGPDAKPFTGSPGDVYGGRWAVYTFDIWGPKPEKKDINRFQSFGIKRLQLLDHDERIASGGGIRTSDGFTAADVGAAPGGGSALSTDDIF